MPVLSYPTADFVAFTKISSADMNGKLTAIKTLLNTTKLDSTNVQLNGLTRDKLALGTASHVLINDGTGLMSSEATLATTRGGLGFAPTISVANAAKLIGVNEAGSALELRTSEASLLAVNLANHVTTLKAGEALSIRDAVCLKLNEGAYKVFKADSDGSDTNLTFFGFALAAATVTAQVSTVAISPAAWTSGTATITVNGRAYSQAFSSNHNTSVDALAAQLAGDVDVLSCSTSGDPRSLLTFTGEGGLTLTIVITTNPTGATFGTPATTTAANGDSVRIQYLGGLSGFSALTVGELYYLSSTAGAITSSPTVANAAFVGQAIASDTVFINPQKFNYIFQPSAIFIRAGGGSNPASTTTATSDVEHYNRSSWSTGTAISTTKRSAGHGDTSYAGRIHAISGRNSAGTSVTDGYSYNKTSWTSMGTLNSLDSHGTGVVDNKLIAAKGRDSGGGYLTAVYTWNGTTWTTPASMAAARASCSGFTRSGVFSCIGGYNAGNHDSHDTWNGTSTGTASVITTSGENTIGFLTASSKGLIGGFGGNSTSTLEWNGSSWAAGGALSSSVNNSGGDDQKTGLNGCGAFSGAAVGVINGGANSGATAITTTQHYNGTTWSAPTNSALARAANIGGVI